MVYDLSLFEEKLDFIPLFDPVTLEENERTLTFIDEVGRTRKALKEGSLRGARMSMDTYIVPRPSSIGT